MATSEWLRSYSNRFGTVELNNTFYRLPASATFAGWCEQVPPTFAFAMKASRFLTHIKRLRAPEEPLARLLAHARPLGRTLKVVLYQLPPRWIPDRDRLETFLAALPAGLADGAYPLHHVIEMRDLRGYEPPTLDLLTRHGVSLCVHDMPDSAAPRVTVGPISYVRFHGYGAKYGGSYPEEVLEDWAGWVADGLEGGRDAYVYFNNDVNGYAVQNAERFRCLVTSGRKGGVARRAGNRVAR